MTSQQNISVKYPFLKLPAPVTHMGL